MTAGRRQSSPVSITRVLLLIPAVTVGGKCTGVSLAAAALVCWIPPSLPRLSLASHVLPFQTSRGTAWPASENVSHPATVQTAPARWPTDSAEPQHLLNSFTHPQVPFIAVLKLAAGGKSTLSVAQTAAVDASTLACVCVFVCGRAGLHSFSFRSTSAVNNTV